jgi:hypothetical protein
MVNSLSSALASCIMAAIEDYKLLMRDVLLNSISYLVAGSYSPIEGVLNFSA